MTDEAKIKAAEEAFWGAIPVGALVRPGAVDWIAYGLRIALAAYSEDPAVPPLLMRTPGPLPDEFAFPVWGTAIIACAVGVFGGFVVAMVLP